MYDSVTEPAPSEALKLRVAGTLSTRDVKRLTKALRGGTVGPTALYYAGVTAPIISAAMALLTKTSLGLVGMTAYWQIMISAIVAAMSGIVWYLIFMRWSYRHRQSRARETEIETEVFIGDDGLRILRGHVETRIAWAAIRNVSHMRGGTFVHFDGAPALIVPDKWFGKDKSARHAFQTALETRKVSP